MPADDGGSRLGVGIGSDGHETGLLMFLLLQIIIPKTATAKEEEEEEVVKNVFVACIAEKMEK